PLLYVELFTRIGTWDPSTGFFLASPSTRRHERRCVIVTANDLIAPCHLILKSSPPSKWPRQWRSDTVLEHASQFTINAYIDLHTFVAINIET
ncbi:hypothetical protein BC834DRAFT_831591, partial [Gloeopeniophorella convolvens]